MNEPHTYRHYKGGLYEVLSTDAVVEAHGVDSERQVVYRSLKDGQIWIRPVSSFFEVLERDGAGVPRFAPVVEL